MGAQLGGKCGHGPDGEEVQAGPVWHVLGLDLGDAAAVDKLHARERLGVECPADAPPHAQHKLPVRVPLDPPPQLRGRRARALLPTALLQHQQRPQVPGLRAPDAVLLAPQ
eukprot:38346-Rhodomonas_salina.1